MQATSAVSRGGKYVSLLLVGVGLPGLLALVDRLLLERLSQSRSPAYEAVLAFGVYAGQLALVSWVVARFIEPWPLRWFLWVWTMALVDLQLAVMFNEPQSTPAVHCLATGVLAAQCGALLVWGILGTGPLLWRVPSLLMLLLVASNCFAVLTRVSTGGPFYQLGWNDLLWVQATILSALCGVMRLSGFALAKTSAASSALAPADARRVQFGIRDVLVGTTGLAILLGVAKAGDLLTWRFLQSTYSAGFLFVFLAAICTAATLLVALWAALGQGRATTRFLVLVLAALALGAPIAAYCVHELAAGRARPLVLYNSRLFHWYTTGYWWLGWMFLAGTLLAGLLVIFRELGYRLVRKARSA